MIYKVEYESDYVLRVSFYNGMVKLIDFLPDIKQRAILKRYLKLENFKKFKYSDTRIEWPGNRYDYHNGQLVEMPGKVIKKGRTANARILRLTWYEKLKILSPMAVEYAYFKKYKDSLTVNKETTARIIFNNIIENSKDYNRAVRLNLI